MDLVLWSSPKGGQGEGSNLWMSYVNGPTVQQSKVDSAVGLMSIPQQECASKSLLLIHEHGHYYG